MGNVIFAEGVYKVKKVNDKLVSAVFKVDDFYRWAIQHKSPKGYITVNFCQSSQSDMWYARLNEYNKEQLAKKELDYNREQQAKKPAIDLKENNIPF